MNVSIREYLVLQCMLFFYHHIPAVSDGETEMNIFFKEFSYSDEGSIDIIGSFFSRNLC